MNTSPNEIKALVIDSIDGDSGVAFSFHAEFDDKEIKSILIYPAPYQDSFLPLKDITLPDIDQIKFRDFCVDKYEAVWTLYNKFSYEINNKVTVLRNVHFSVIPLYMHQTYHSGEIISTPLDLAHTVLGCDFSHVNQAGGVQIRFDSSLRHVKYVFLFLSLYSKYRQDFLSDIQGRNNESR